MARLVVVVGKRPTMWSGVDITLGVWAYLKVSETSTRRT